MSTTTTQQPRDWKEAILSLRRKDGKMNPIELERDASTWMRCAVGSALDVPSICRDIHESTIAVEAAAPELIELGTDFNDMIDLRRLDGALTMLDRIDATIRLAGGIDDCRERMRRAITQERIYEVQERTLDALLKLRGHHRGKYEKIAAEQDALLRAAADLYGDFKALDEKLYQADALIAQKVIAALNAAPDKPKTQDGS